jgi:glutathione S-transferase
VLITGSKDGNRYIPESSAIATYLIRTFDTEDKFGLKNGDWIRDEMLVSMCLSTLARNTFFLLMLDFGVISNRDSNMMDGPELRNFLKELERELKEGPKGGFFMGKQPGRADILMEFPMTSITQRKSVDMEKEFPELWAWLQRVYARPAWKRGLEKAFGGVYDLTVFPKKPRL